MTKQLRILLSLAFAVSLPIASCTLITEIDRSLIDEDAGGEGGQGGSDGASTGGASPTGGIGGQGGDAPGGGGNGGAG